MGRSAREIEVKNGNAADRLLDRLTRPFSFFFSAGYFQ
jgi:hypothetical protein